MPGLATYMVCGERIRCPCWRLTPPEACPTFVSPPLPTEDVALRMLPAVCPLCMDPVPEVRGASLTLIETFLKVLQDEEQVRRSREAAAVEAGGGSGAMAGSGGAGGGGAAAGSASSYFSNQALGATSSMLTWAVSGLMNTVGGSNPAAPAQAVVAAPAAAPAAAAATPARAAPAAASRPAAALPSASSGAGKAEGWGGGDGWEDDDENFEVSTPGFFGDGQNPTVYS